MDDAARQGFEAHKAILVRIQVQLCRRGLASTVSDAQKWCSRKTFELWAAHRNLKDIETQAGMVTRQFLQALEAWEEEVLC